MLRKHQIILEFLHITLGMAAFVVADAVLPGISFWQTPIQIGLFFVVYLFAFAYLRGAESRLHLYQTPGNYLRNTALLSIAATSASLSKQTSSFLIAFSIIAIIQFMVDMLFIAFESQYYKRVSAAAIRTLFIGPPHLHEQLISEFQKRGIKQLKSLGYIDYKRGDSDIRFLGKFVDLRSVLHDFKPALIINCGRNEQHVSVFSLARDHGIDYIGAPEHLIWTDVQKNHRSPFHMPFIRYSTRRLTNWAHAQKRVIDTVSSTLLIVILFPLYLVKRLKHPVELQSWTDPRNQRTTKIVLEPGWKQYRNLHHVVMGRLALVGPLPQEPVAKYDLKHGVLYAPADLKQYAESWNLLQEMQIVLKGSIHMIQSFFV